MNEVKLKRFNSCHNSLLVTVMDNKNFDIPFTQILFKNFEGIAEEFGRRTAFKSLEAQLLATL